EAVAGGDADLAPFAIVVTRGRVAVAAAPVTALLLRPSAELEHLLGHVAHGDVHRQRARIIRDAFADPVQAGIVAATLEHREGTVQARYVLRRLDQARQVALDELVLQGQGRGRHHDALVVDQARDEVRERLTRTG